MTRDSKIDEVGKSVAKQKEKLKLRDSNEYRTE